MNCVKKSAAVQAARLGRVAFTGFYELTDVEFKLIHQK